jgi:hypothetical protein
MEHFDDLMKTLGGDYANLLGYILALAAFTMALLQLVNDLTPVRAICHTFLLRSWIRERVRLYGAAGGLSPTKVGAPIDTNEALAQLTAHATGGHPLALFGLPPPQLVAQINAAAQGALDNPAANYSLIAVLSQPADAYIPRLLPRSQTPGRVASHIEDLSILLDPPVSPPPVEGEGGESDAKRQAAMKDYESKMKRYADARTLIVHRIQRNLDGMQITLGNASAVVTQILAILIAVAICYAITVKNLIPEHTYFTTVLLIGISAGYIAPVLGDIVVAIRRFGRPT